MFRHLHLLDAKVGKSQSNPERGEPKARDRDAGKTSMERSNTETTFVKLSWRTRRSLSHSSSRSSGYTRAGEPGWTGNT
jgi:hypothetical protein